MTSLDRLGERYRNDVTFKAMVDLLRSMVERLELTPSEVREAAVFACMMVEERTLHMVRIADIAPPPTYEAREAYRLLKALSNEDRGRVLCWFCRSCRGYIGPGESHSCEEGRTDAAQTKAHARADIIDEIRQFRSGFESDDAQYFLQWTINHLEGKGPP
jgi:hypothetical protein